MNIRATDTTATTENRECERGFALVSVLFVLAFLALAAATAARALQMHLAQARNVTAAAQAAAAADAGVALAILDLAASRAGESGGARSAGPAKACLMRGGAILKISLYDAAGRIDLNHASEPLLGALLRGAGLAPADARLKAAAIADYRDDDDDVRAEGAERASYLALGLAGPKNGAFESVAELTGVAGFDKALAERLQPHLTVHSMLDGVDPAAATPQLLTLLGGGRADLAPQFRAVSPGRTFTVAALAFMPNGTRASRSATIALRAPHLGRTARMAIEAGRTRAPVSTKEDASTGLDAMDYAVLAWGHGAIDERTDDPRAHPGARLPPC